MVKHTVGLVGCGMMGQALAKGLLDRGIVEQGNLFASDPYTPFETLPWVSEYQVHTGRDNVECVNAAEIIILAVKPFLMDELLIDLKKREVDMSKKLLISLVSGYTLDRLRGFDMGTKRIVRIMPNTPAMVGEGSTAVSAKSDVSVEDLELVKSLMAAVGKAWVIPEKRMNIWTASAGAGPAYVFQFIEAIADSAVAGGIPRDVANDMAIQLVLGSAKMAQQSKQHIAQLKDNVCSPAGVTITGVQGLQERAFPGTIMAAIEKAKIRYDVVEANPNL